jgi:hypothetical protein
MWKAIDKFGIFFSNFFTALKFSAYDYDVVLQRTKTTKQRIIIWVSIFILIVGSIFGFLFILNHYIRTIINSRFSK